jgi:hypothetical protein
MRLRSSARSLRRRHREGPGRAAGTASLRSDRRGRRLQPQLLFFGFLRPQFSAIQFLEADRTQFGIAGRVLDCPVPELILDQPRVMARVGAGAREPTALATRVPASKLWPKCIGLFWFEPEVEIRAT